MSREVRRVPVDFDWPIGKTWDGFLMPRHLDETSCPNCEGGRSTFAQRLFDQWYGYVAFDPASTGSTPFRLDTPEVRAFAERNVAQAPWYYGTGEAAIVKEAQRLLDLWNNMWCHHLAQEDVDALLAAGRLWDFTHRIEQGKGWVKLEVAVRPSAAEINAWSLTGFGHDALNASVVLRARCERAGEPYVCEHCNGHGSLEAYPGQRDEAADWEPTDPPVGEGWQVWESVSEGSPISPVFPDREGLIGWLMSPAYTWGTSQPLTREQAEAFVDDGSSIGSFVSIGGKFMQGDAAVHEFGKDGES